MSTIRFSAKVISGRARGRKLGVPTLNLNLADVPAELEDGLYACRVVIGERTYGGTLHMGPRPTFNDTRTCEVHVIDEEIPSPPIAVAIEILKFLRPIATFPTADALAAQMMQDIRQTKEILGKQSGTETSI